MQQLSVLVELAKALAEAEKPATGQAVAPNLKLRGESAKQEVDVAMRSGPASAMARHPEIPVRESGLGCDLLARVARRVWRCLPPNRQCDDLLGGIREGSLGRAHWGRLIGEGSSRGTHRW